MEILREVVDFGHRAVIYPQLTSGEAQIDREVAHDRAFAPLTFLERHHHIRAVLARGFTYRDALLETTVWGIPFEGVIGMAAGFDKDFLAPNAIMTFFGFLEGGTVTPLPQPGRDQPRIFHLPLDRGLINRMGFPSAGMEVVASRLGKLRKDPGKILGINIGANAKSVEQGRAIEDYIVAAKRLIEFADYITINVSSPNTTNLRDLQGKAAIRAIAEEVYKVAVGYDQKTGRKVPIVIKLAPDLSNQEIDEILEATEGLVDGFIMGNTTINKEIRAKLLSEHKDEAGGISGRPLRELTLERASYISERTMGQVPLIVAGGIGDVEALWNAYSYGGADLVQIYTAWVEKSSSSPNLIFNLSKSFATRLRELGVKNVRELRGAKVPFYFDKTVQTTPPPRYYSRHC